MVDAIPDDESDTVTVDDDPKSSARLLASIKKAEMSLHAWQALCDRIDDIYSREDAYRSEYWLDQDYDLFWASMEIMKPAVYAKPPQPVVSPQFKDRRPLPNVTAELLERAVVSAFERTDIDEAMCHTRDDLIFYNRGQMWVTYENDDGQKICVEHLDRKDFLYWPARKWSEVPAVARRAWMTREEMRVRFETHSGDAYMQATLTERQPDREYQMRSQVKKAGVWEVWHRADKRVYWVADGCPVFLDEAAPHEKLRKFFPCPKPAFGTMRPRTLVPIPDYVRYAGHFAQINSLTKRIYDLLDEVRMKGLIPAGGDVAETVEQLVRDNTNSTMLIPVPAAALMTSGAGSTGFVQWLPLAEIATAITGLIEARRELFSDYDRLSGISDIMRGETEAEETLGAQQLKSQYGSVRVREKVEELQRIAKDVVQIAAEIMAEKFSSETLLEMSQMDILTKAEIDRQIKKLEKDAENELEDAMKAAKEAADSAGPEADPAVAQQQLQTAQQEIVKRYGAMIKQYEDQVPIEDVMKLLRDDKARGFAFEVATDSTILTDEMQEKASRNEFLTVFSSATQGLSGLAAMGEAGAKLAGEVLKFTVQPYRAGRELNAAIDAFVDAAPEMAAKMGEGQGGEAEKAMADANMKLAEAEVQKAQAAIAKVQADTQKANQDIQLRAAEAQESAKADQQRFMLEVEDTKGKIAKTQADIQKIMAEIQKMGATTQIEAHREQREDIKTAADITMRQEDQALNAQNTERDTAFRAKEDMRADRQQDFSERSGDRQMTLAERQAEKEPAK